jgi:hypothetical protein
MFATAKEAREGSFAKEASRKSFESYPGAGKETDVYMK